MSEKMPPSKDAAHILTHQPRVGTLQGAWLFLCAVAYRYLCEIIFFQFKIRDRKFWAAQKPNRVQSYPTRPMLRHHVFIPASHQEGQKHPVYLLIHGVAFIIGSPAMDHAQARFLADQHNYVVVALSYRRAPEHRFPTAIHDVAAVIAAVLEDKFLPIDTQRVVVGGFSAGATIALAVAQLPELKDRIKALVPFQPLTDRSGEARGVYPDVMPWGGEDDMKKTQVLSDWAFPPAGQDMRDRLLSPYHATRANIPQPVCFITGSADMFCQEGYLLACKLASRPAGNDFSKAWEQNGVKYWCAEDMPHDWTHFWVQLKGEWRIKQLRVQDEAWQQVVTWLDKILYT
ncbi:Alpha/Beta hydrolase protein [Xylariales sp. AK1849]|nr:Alpha/Beta hydrolase protein [Xylariales sp. AK1849]